MDLEFTLKAQKLAELQKWDTLQQICKAQLRNAPEETYAIYYLALSHQAKGEFQTAKSLIEPMLDKMLFNTDFKGLYADILTQEKSFKQAEAVIKELLASDPNNESNLALLSKVKLGLLNYEEAILFAKKALAINPSNEAAANVLLLTYQLQGKPNEDTLGAILKENPHNSFAITQKIESLLDNNQYDEAYDLALNALSLYPLDVYLKTTTEEVIGTESSIIRFYRKVNLKIKTALIKGKTPFQMTLLFMGIALVAIINLLDRSSFSANTAGYFLFLILFSTTFYSPINQCYVGSHYVGKKLYDSRSKKLILLIKALFFAGLLLSSVGLYFHNTLCLLLSLASLSTTVPLAFINAIEDRPRKNLIIVYSINALLIVLSFSLNSTKLLVLSTFLNCMALSINALFCAMEVLREKYK